MFSPSRLVGLIAVCAMYVIACNRGAAHSSGIATPVRASGSAPPLTTCDISSEDETGKPAKCSEHTVPLPLNNAYIPVAVIRTNGFTHAGDSAVILRRHTAWPYNVIVMDDEHLSVPILGAAITALAHEVKASGEVPATDYAIPVRGAAIPKSWTSASPLPYLAKWELDTLKHIPLSNVQGIGDVPAILISLAQPKR